MNMFGRGLLVAGIGLMASQAHAQGYWRPGDVFVCQSNGYQQNYCNADTRFGVVLRRQISNASCIRGRTWGFDHRGVWVTNGCKGEFEVVARRAPPPPPPAYGGQMVVCKSSGYQQEYCPVDTRGGVRLARQMSSSECLRGRTWGTDRGGIWVADGCQAEFMVGGGWGQGYQPLPPSVFVPARVVRCESMDGRVNRCQVFTRGGVRVQNQLSNTPCYQGRNWGWDRNGIWVSGGCRADFRIGGFYR